MEKVLYHLYELKTPAGHDLSTPKYKLVKEGKGPGFFAWSDLYKKSKESPPEGFNLSYGSEGDAPDEILPGAAVSVVEKVGKDQAGPANEVRRWFVELDDHTTDDDLRECRLLDFDQVQIGDTYWDFNEVPPKSKTFGEFSFEDDTPPKRVLTDMPYCLYQLNYAPIIEALKPEIEKSLPYYFVLRDSQGNRYNARLIFNSGKVHSVTFEQADGYQLIGDVLSRDCFNCTRDQLIVGINSEINKLQCQNQNIDTLLSQITYESITGPQDITIQDPDFGYEIKLILSYDGSTGKCSFEQVGGSNRTTLSDENFYDYFGQEKDHIVRCISAKQDEVKAQRLAANVDAVKTAAKASPAPFDITDENGKLVNVQLTCDKDGNVSGLEKKPEGRSTFQFWSSKPQELSSADYQAFFGVTDKSAFIEELKTAAAAASTCAGPGASIHVAGLTRGGTGVHLSSTSSDPSSKPSAGHTIDPMKIQEMRKVLNTHQSPEEITAGTGDQAFTIKREKFESPEDASHIGRFDYNVKQGTSDLKTARVTLSPQYSPGSSGFHARATTSDGASKDAQLVACALALAEGHLAEAVAKDPSATSDFEVNFTVHLDKYQGKQELVSGAIENFYKVFAEKHSYTIGGTVQFTGVDHKLIPGKELTVDASSGSPAPGV